MLALPKAKRQEHKDAEQLASHATADVYHAHALFAALLPASVRRRAVLLAPVCLEFGGRRAAKRHRPPPSMFRWTEVTSGAVPEGLRTLFSELFSILNADKELGCFEKPHDVQNRTKTRLVASSSK